MSLGFSGGVVVKNLPANAGDAGSIPGLGRSPGGGNGNLFQYSLSGKFHRQKSLVGYGPWGSKESDTTEPTHTHTHMPVSILSFQHGPLCSFIYRAGLLMRNLLFCIFLNWQCLHFSLFLNFSLDMEFLVDNPFSTSTLLFYCLLASIVSDEKSAINFIVYPLYLWVIFLLLFSGFSLCLLTVCLWYIQV